MFVFGAFMQRAEPDSLLPLLFWSYGVAMTPLMCTASREPDNLWTMTTTFFAQVGHVAVIGGTLLVSLNGRETLLLFTAVMMVGMLMHTRAKAELNRFVAEEQEMSSLREAPSNAVPE
jgi:hypothetical protein